MRLGVMVLCAALVLGGPQSVDAQKRVRTVAAYASVLHHAEVPLSHSQILTLQSAPVVVVPSACATCVVEVVTAAFIGHIVVPYGAITEPSFLQLSFASGANLTAPTGTTAVLSDEPGDYWAPVPVVAAWYDTWPIIPTIAANIGGPVNGFAGQAVVLRTFLQWTDYTGGDTANSVQVLLTYLVRDLSTGLLVPAP